MFIRQVKFRSSENAQSYSQQYLWRSRGRQSSLISDTHNMLQLKHCLFLSLLLTVIIVCVFVVKYVDDIEDDIDEYDSLENDILYKYRIHLENSNNRPIRLMSQRKNLLDDICKKYEDPFRLKINQISLRIKLIRMLQGLNTEDFTEHTLQ